MTIRRGELQDNEEMDRMKRMMEEMNAAMMELKRVAEGEIEELGIKIIRNENEVLNMGKLDGEDKKDTHGKLEYKEAEEEENDRDLLFSRVEDGQKYFHRTGVA